MHPTPWTKGPELLVAADVLLHWSICEDMSSLPLDQGATSSSNQIIGLSHRGPMFSLCTAEKPRRYHDSHNQIHTVSNCYLWNHQWHCQPHLQGLVPLPPVGPCCDTLFSHAPDLCWYTCHVQSTLQKYHRVYQLHNSQDMWRNEQTQIWELTNTHRHQSQQLIRRSVPTNDNWWVPERK